MFADTPEPPYTAVIFTSLRSDQGGEDYQQMAAEMERLASEHDGFLGVESARDDNGLGITVSYWTSHAAAGVFRRNGQHLVAQRLGRERWYSRYVLRICRVDHARDYADPADGSTEGSSD